jgi:hypothetical protein
MASRNPAAFPGLGFRRVAPGNYANLVPAMDELETLKNSIDDRASLDS